LYPYAYIWRIGTSVTVIKVVPAGITVRVPAAVVSVIIIIPVIVIPVIVMPVKWLPWMPERRVIVPIPGRVPWSIGGKENKSYQGPVYNLNIPPIISSCISGISRIWCLAGIRFIKYGFNDIIPAI
jgi:hypothetical protein